MTQSKNKIRIFIADDHFEVRQGLKHIISQNADMEVIGEAEEGNQMLERVKYLVADVILLDIEMAKKNGWEVMLQLKYRYQHLKILMLSIFSEEHYGLRLIKAGASGCLAKSSASDLLWLAIRTVAAGGKFISPSLTDRLIEELHVDSTKLRHENLSSREFQVFCMIASGKRTKEIANEISVSITTINTHRANIIEKLGLKNNTDLVRYALENGFAKNGPIDQI